MNTQYKLSLCVIAFAGVTNGAIGQSRPDPTDAKLQSPTTEYVSPYTSYRRYQEEKPASWRELNDQVLRLGGHAGHIKDGTPGVAKPAATPEASVPRGASAPSLPAGTADPGHSSHKH